MSKVKVLIVEDQAITANNIYFTLLDYGYDVIEPAFTYTEAIEKIEAENPDIAILDIVLGGNKSGIDLAQQINGKYKFPFLFLSSNSDRVTLTEAKSVEPYAYLVKPFGKEELYTSIEVALYNFAKQNEKALDEEKLVIRDALFVKDKRAFQRINFKDILYIQSDRVYLDIYLVDGKKMTIRASLNEYIGKLSKSFFRSHRSYIINLDYLDSIKSNIVIIKNTELPLGQIQKEELLEKLNKG